MCFVKCKDRTKPSDDIELLSSKSNLKDYRIRRLLDEHFITEAKYIDMKKRFGSDEEVLKQLAVQAEKGGIKEEFDLLVNSGKEKVDSLLEL